MIMNSVLAPSRLGDGPVGTMSSNLAVEYSAEKGSLGRPSAEFGSVLEGGSCHCSSCEMSPSLMSGCPETTPTCNVECCDSCGTEDSALHVGELGGRESELGIFPSAMQYGSLFGVSAVSVIAENLGARLGIEGVPDPFNLLRNSIGARQATAFLGTDYTLFQLHEDPVAGDGCGDCESLSPHISAPSFRDVHPATQSCFEAEFNLKDWPESDCCCLPALVQDDGCELPSLDSWIEVLVETQVLNADGTYRSRPADDLGADEWVNPSSADLEFFFSAMVLLRENIDTVSWAACQVEQWSMEIAGLGLPSRIESLIGWRGGSKLAVAFVGLSKSHKGATGWAKVDGQAQSQGFPLTMIVPTNNSTLIGMRDRFRAGGPEGLCALVQMAQIILHEIVHVVGDRYDVGKWKGYGPVWADYLDYDNDGYGFAGTRHDDNAELDGVSAEEAGFGKYTCFDECRMVASMFVWGVHQRRTCLSSARDCDFMKDPNIFANSINGGG